MTMEKQTCFNTGGEKVDHALKAICELRKAVLCLRLELPQSIADDVERKAEAVIALLKE